MKKFYRSIFRIFPALGITILIFLQAGILTASHRSRLNAGNLTQGTLPNARLDPTSVTLQGNAMDLRPSSATYQGSAVSISTVGGGLQSLYDRFQLFLASAVVAGAPVSIGPLGEAGVDIASNTEDGLTEALRRIGALGLTFSTTAQGRITYRNGTYVYNPTTVPAGVELIGGSSVVWVNADMTKTLLTNYGTVDGITMDSSGRNILGVVLILPKSNSKTKMKIRNVQTGGTTIKNVLKVESSTNVTCDIDIDNFDLFDSALVTGDGTPISVMYSSGVWLKLVTGEQVTTGNTFLTVTFSANVHITDSIFRNVIGTEFIQLYGGTGSQPRHIFFQRNEMHIKTGSVGGAIAIDNNATTGPISSGTVITDNFFSYEATLGNGIIVKLGATTGAHAGTWIANNHVVRPFNTGAVTFASVGSSVNDTRLIHNNCDNTLPTCYTDAGTRTLIHTP